MRQIGVSRALHVGMAEQPLHTGHSEALDIPQLLDVQDHLDILATIPANAADCKRPELCELRLPEAKNVQGQVTQRAHLAYAEVDFIRYGDGGLRVLRALSHALSIARVVKLYSFESRPGKPVAKR
jgi:hypothetical protein